MVFFPKALATTAAALAVAGNVATLAGATPLADRQLGAIMGALVADAAVMPLHWIYNQTDVQILGGSTPEFHDPPHCHDERVVTHCDYDYPLGENTLYGQQLRAYLELFADQGVKVGAVNAEELAHAYYGLYGAPSGACANISTGVNSTGCYWDKSTKEFVANVRANSSCVTDNSCGGDDDQADALAHQLLTTVLGSTPLSEESLQNVLSDARTVVTVTQSNDQASAFGMAGARILQAVVAGTVPTPRAAVLGTIHDLLDPNRLLPNHEDFILAAGLQYVVNEANVSNEVLTMLVGQSCDYPNNLLSGSHMLYQFAEPPGAGNNATANYVAAIRQLILAGGDQASRGIFVGGVLGALAGEEGIPQSWKDRYTHYSDTLSMAKKVIANL